MNWTTFVVFAALFSFVTWLVFAAARWRGGNLDQLDEWGLGGRRFLLTYAVQLQLLGGVWIIQTLPAVLGALYTRFFKGWTLLTGWATGMAAATVMAGQLNFTTPIYPLTVGGFTFPCYIALPSLLLNVAVAAVLSVAIKFFFAVPSPSAVAKPLG